MSRLVLRDAEFAELRAVLAQAAGLAFDETRRDSMAVGVAERLRATGAAGVADYLVLLRGREERQRLLEEVTIQETYFFRNPPQVQALRTHVLPELVRAAQESGRRRLRVWSAGCSTGEEPYTVAMLLRELLPDMAGWDVQVLGTDVSRRALQAAERARYGPRAVHTAAPEDLARFFAVAPEGGYEVRSEVRSLVRLRHHNLVTDAPPFAPGEVDLVLCRNVTIYFARETTRALVERFHATLHPGGYLALGHAETLWQVSDAFRLVQVGAGAGAAFFYAPLARSAQGRAAAPVRASARRPVENAAGAARALAGAGTRGARAAAEAPAPPAPAAPVEPADPVTEVRTALAEGRYAQAVRAASALIARQPLSAAAHYLRGLALVDLRQDADALADLRKAVYLAPDDGFAHFLLAGVLARLGDPEAARREYAAAATTLGAQPGDRDAGELGGRDLAELAGLCRRLSRS